tara:strand:+ start:3306 stop:3656 length:351 start_codon:yes stop_codon:yes gene_type:complete
MAFYMKPGRGPMVKTGRGIDTVALMKGNPLQQENNTAKRKAEGVDPTEEEFKKTLAPHKITKPNKAVKKVLKPAPFPTSSFEKNLRPRPVDLPTPPKNKKKKTVKKNPNNRLGVHF